MFGKPDWFVPKKFGWGLTPVTWQGWVYAFGWALAIVLPFNLLMFTRGWPEAMLWMAAMIAFVVFDVKLILRAMKRRDEDKELLHIMDDKETRREEAQTNKFQMHVARRDA
jgi:hypothetical protein